VDGTGPVVCLIAGFGTSNVETFSCVTGGLVD
jgi:hypothetical protein